jgi:hypothetical protein
MAAFARATLREGPVGLATEDVYRHPLIVRVWHWLTAATVLGLLFSGICILDVKGRGGWWEDFDNAVWYAGQ